jgi:hypothetical protein
MKLDLEFTVERPHDLGTKMQIRKGRRAASAAVVTFESRERGTGDAEASPLLPSSPPGRDAAEFIHGSSLGIPSTGS